jgi:hypothetical protein
MGLLHLNDLKNIEKIVQSDKSLLNNPFNHFYSINPSNDI